MYTLKKIFNSLLTIFIIISLSFILIHIMPGDPLISLVGQEEYYYLLDNNPEQLKSVEEKYGLNDSLLKQYVNYLKSIINLDFGIAYENHAPVLDNVLNACKFTLMLSMPTWILGGILGCILGTFAGWKPSGIYDKITTPIFLIIGTVPSNCLGILALSLFAYKLKLFPLNGMVSPGLTGFFKYKSMLHHLTLPLIILVILRTSSNFMLMKSCVSQVKEEDYIITAASKGLTPNKILFKHLLKNALVPYMSLMFIQLGFILSGSMLIEVIFGWKGMGQLMVNAVDKKDFPTAQLCFLITAMTVVLGNLLGDIFQNYLDPRLRDGENNDSKK